MSRVPVYLTLLPVSVSHGFDHRQEGFCSSPPHVPMTVTDLPPPLVPPPEQAARTSIVAPANAATRRQRDSASASMSPFLGSGSAAVHLLHGPPHRNVPSGSRAVSLLLVRPRAVEDRTMSSVGSRVRSGTGRPATRSSRAVPAAIPRSYAGRRTVVSGGSKNAASSMSSNPTMEMSSGTRRPASRIAAIAPKATTSLATKTASIGPWERSSAIARWPLPASKEAWATSRSSNGEPAASSAAR